MKKDWLTISHHKAFIIIRYLTTALVWFGCLFLNHGYLYAPLIAYGYYYLYYYCLVTLPLRNKKMVLINEATSYLEALKINKVGHSLETALMLTCQTNHSEFSYLMSKALLNIKLGHSLDEAFELLDIHFNELDEILYDLRSDHLDDAIQLANQIKLLSFKEKQNYLLIKALALSLIFLLLISFIIIYGPTI